MSEATAESLGTVTRLQRRVYEVLDGAVMDRTSKIVEIFIASTNRFSMCSTPSA